MKTASAVYKHILLIPFFLIFVSISCSDLFTKVPVGDNFQAVDTRLLGDWELPGGALAQIEGKGLNIARIL